VTYCTGIAVLQKPFLASAYNILLPTMDEAEGCSDFIAIFQMFIYLGVSPWIVRKYKFLESVIFF